MSTSGDGSNWWASAAEPEVRPAPTPAPATDYRLPVPPSMLPGQPPPTPQLPVAHTGTDQVLFNIGDIGVSRYWVVTPNGSAPLSGSSWIVNDLTRTETKIPTWAIVFAILTFVLCLLGLLFLLVKETVTTGYVEVQVRSGNLFHLTQIPVSSPLHVQEIRARVGQAQSMAAQA